MQLDQCDETLNGTLPSVMMIVISLSFLHRPTACKYWIIRHLCHFLAAELIDLTSLEGSFYVRSGPNFSRFNTGHPLYSALHAGGGANNESSEVYGIIKSGRRVKLNRSLAVNVHKLLTIRYSRAGDCETWRSCKWYRIGDEDRRETLEVVW